MIPEFEATAERIRALLAQGSRDLGAFLRDQHPADLAELLEGLSREDQVALLRQLDSEQAALVLGELDLEAQTHLVDALGQETSGDIIDEMSADDAADLLGEMSPEQAGELLGQMEAQDAADVRELMAYDPDSAGGLMTTNFVAVQSTWSAERTIAEMRRLSPDAETAYYMYVVDEAEQLVGVLSLRELVVAPPERQIAAIMRRRLVTVQTSDDQEEVARTVSKYNLMAVPVVDEQGVLCGIITHDDVIDVLEEEATEDIYQFASTTAAEAEAGPRSGVWLAVRARMPWLVALLFLEMLAGKVVDHFSGLIQAMTILTVFMPVMAGASGNASTQSLAVVVRGLATGELEVGNVAAVVWRELRVGLVLGVVCGAVLFAFTWAWQGDVRLAIIVGTALVINIPTAKTLGALFPVIIHRVGIDPAVASGPLITTVADVVTNLAYFGVATLIITRFA